MSDTNNTTPVSPIHAACDSFIASIMEGSSNVRAAQQGLVAYLVGQTAKMEEDKRPEFIVSATRELLGAKLQAHRTWMEAHTGADNSPEREKRTQGFRNVASALTTGKVAGKGYRVSVCMSLQANKLGVVNYGLIECKVAAVKPFDLEVELKALGKLLAGIPVSDKASRHIATAVADWQDGEAATE